MLTLSVVIPALDELDNLRFLLPQIQSSLSELDEVVSKIYVILGTDAVNSDIQELKKIGVFPIIRSPSNSFGDAIRTGLEIASTPPSDLLLIMDADGSHSPSTIPKLVHAIIENDLDVVIASRYVSGGSSANSRVLQVMSRILNITYSLVLGIKAKDISTNFKIYRGNLIEGIELRCNNFDIVEELLLELKRKTGNNLRIQEVPDYFAVRMHGHSKRNLIKFIFSYTLTLFRLRFGRHFK